MTTTTGAKPTRAPLSRERVLQTAVDLADRSGIEALTMRNLASELGVEAMSLYYHVANKDAVLDGVVDVLMTRINDLVETLDRPSPEEDWKTGLRLQILLAREVMLEHPWAPAVIESRTSITPAMAMYFETVMTVMIEGGFSYDLAHHALHALGSRAVGFTQELFQPDDSQGEDDMSEMMGAMAEHLPHMTAMLGSVSHDDPDSTLGWCDDQTEFEFGLDLLLDGLDRLQATS